MADKTKNINIGLLAHVDAGKTTLSEALLYLSGKIKNQGRVDHGDTCLDTHSLERKRGITIFSKQAVLSLANTEITILDTPGHVDFSTEMERTLQVLDYAVLVISGTDGVQSHTETLWYLLKKYNIPTFIFITKMDINTCDKSALISQLKKEFGDGCVDFTNLNFDDIAITCDEALEIYSNKSAFSDKEIAEFISSRALFPCFFGSGLKLDGVNEFMECLDKYTLMHSYPDSFAAKVFKISRDAQGNRLTHVKITGGQLKIRTPIAYTDSEGNQVEEKVTGIRIYSGAKFESAEIVDAGKVCILTGLNSTYAGQSLGSESKHQSSILEPVLTYRIVLPEGTDTRVAYKKLLELNEEDPQLKITWNSEKGEINIQLMGAIQIEILKSIISDRFGWDIQIDQGHILYRETIAEAVEGIGHFEPLRHYAEVHLKLEPLPRGSGVIMCADCSEDELDRNWQRLILTNLYEKVHKGVLTGAPISDIKITLIAGRAHLKHTEGGDFRQATYRAVRQGLMKARNILLEPYYSFRLEVPQDQLGRAINDIRSMNGSISDTVNGYDSAIVEGRVPVSKAQNYASDVAMYSHGKGKFSCRVDGYEECKDADKVIEETAYNPESDLENTPDSVFCAHGAGFNVKWNEVDEYAHLDTGFGKVSEVLDTPMVRMRNLSIDDKELEAIMEREFGPIKRPMYTKRQTSSEHVEINLNRKKDYIFVDGYNVIHAWPELSLIAEDNLDLARNQLMDIMANYKGYTKNEVVLVFDAYAVSDSSNRKQDLNGVHIVFTKQGETADAYIQKVVTDIGKNYNVRVVSGDSIIQLSSLGAGVLRETTKEFYHEVNWVLGMIEQSIKKLDSQAKPAKLGEKVNFNGSK